MSKGGTADRKDNWREGLWKAGTVGDRNCRKEALSKRETLSKGGIDG